MNNEIKSKSIHNNLKNSANRFSKKIKPLEAFMFGIEVT